MAESPWRRFDYSPYQYAPSRKCKNCGFAWKWHNRDNCSAPPPSGRSLGTKFEPCRKSKQSIGRL